MEPNSRFGKVGEFANLSYFYIFPQSSKKLIGTEGMKLSMSMTSLFIGSLVL